MASEGHSVWLTCQVLDEDSRGDSLTSIFVTLYCKKSLETGSALLLSAFCSPESQLAHEKGYASFMHVTLRLLLLAITAFVFSAVTSGIVGLGHSENGCSIIFSPPLGTNHRKPYIPTFTCSKSISTHISLLKHTKAH